MRFSSLMLGIGLAVAGVGQARADTINAALAAAYNHNAQLNAQRAATRAVDEQLAQAKSGFRPTISGSADYGFARTTSNLAGSNGSNPYGFGITVSQSLFDGFRTVNRVASAEAGIRGSREQLRRVEQTVLQSAARAYVDVLVALETVTIRRRNIEFLAEQLRSSQARLDVGEGTRTDVAQSRARLEAARALLSAAQATLEGNRATYFQIIGRQPKGLAWPKGPSRLYPKSLKAALLAGANQHPAVRLTLHSVDAANFAVKVQEGSFLPSVSLNGSAQKGFNRTGQGTDSSSLSATVNVTVPLYQGGLASSQVRESKEILGQRRIEVDQARDEVRAAVVQAWSQLSSSRSNVSANRAQVRAAKLALSGVIEERNVGQRTQLEVLDAQSTVLDAQLSLLAARQGAVDAGYALASSVGRLNSRRLGLPVRHYTPKEHYEAVKDLWYGLRTPSGR